MNCDSFKIRYGGSKFWLVFWSIFCFPIAISLYAARSEFEIGNTVYLIDYEGSLFWFCFWIIFGFPIAIILFYLNGFSVIPEVSEEDDEASEDMMSGKRVATAVAQ